MAGGIIRIQYEPWAEGLTKEQFKRFANDAVKEYGRSFANEIAEQFSMWLSPGYTGLHINPIGASGRASKSFHTAGGKGRKGISTWEVIEGSTATKIRVGLAPGEAVSLATLKLWAARKGLNLLSSVEYKQKYGSKDHEKSGKWTFGKAVEVGAYSKKSSTGNSFDVAAYGKAEAGKKNVVNSALKAIQNALFEAGTDRPGANWMAYFPKAKGHFDYPRYLFTARRRKLETIEGHSASGTAYAMASFWSSGGRVRVRDFKTAKFRGEARAYARKGLF